MTESEINEKIRQAAIAYAKRGFYVFPCTIEKNPYITNGFHKASNDPEQVDKWWSKWPGALIAMPTGKKNNLYIIDLDDKPERPGENGELLPAENGSATLEALESSHSPLPPTKMQITGSGGLHLVFRYPIDRLPDNSYLGNTMRKLGPGFDTRGEGGYFIVAPSKHPSGGRYQWNKTAAKYPFAELPDWIIELLLQKKHKSAPPAIPITNGGGNTRYGEAALHGLVAEMERAPEGTRNGTLNTLSFRAGQLAAGGEIDPAAAEALKYAAHQAGLETKEIRDTFESGFSKGIQYPKSAPAPAPRTARAERPRREPERPKRDEQQEGEPDGAELSHDEIESGSALADNRPVIRIAKGSRHEVIPQIKEIMEPHEILFSRAKQLVSVPRIREDSKERFSFQEVTPESLMTLLERYIRFEKFDIRKNEYVPTDCPIDLARAIIGANLNESWPNLGGIIKAPLIKKDGNILDKPGYDWDTNLYFQTHIDAEGWRIPHDADAEDAKEALQQLKYNLLRTVHFDEEIPGPNGKCSYSESVDIALNITVLQRAVLPTAPMFVVSAPREKAGKSMLADIAHLLATGTTSAPIEYTINEEELGKRVGAKLFQKEPIVCLDNLNGELNSSFMCQVMTSEYVSVRLLGYSKMPSLSTAATWIVNGINASVTQDLRRRAVYARIIPDPEQKKFEHDPLKYCSNDNNRVTCIRWLLTILKAYYNAGKPKQDIEPFNSYDDWSDTIRSALMWLGEPDPLAGQDAMKADDSKADAFSGVLQAWYDNTIGKVSARMLIKNAEFNTELKAALLYACGTARGELLETKVGSFLQRYRGRYEPILLNTDEERLAGLERRITNGRREWILVIKEQKCPASPIPPSPGPPSPGPPKDLFNRSQQTAVPAPASANAGGGPVAAPASANTTQPAFAPPGARMAGAPPRETSPPPPDG